MSGYQKTIYKTFCAVRISIGIILLASLLAGGAGADSVYRVSPILECVADMGDGSYISYWGYNNQNSGTVTIAIGTNNNFNPLPQNRGQPTSFLAGRSPYYPNAAFSVPFDGSNLVWYLKYGSSSSGTATASSNPSNRCKPIITITSPTATTYVTTSIPLIVSANEAISKWNYSLNGGVNITFTPGTTITATVGPNTLIVYAYAANGTSSSWSSSSVDFTVSPPTKLDQTITFGTLNDKTFGDSNFGVSATASSGLPVSFTASGTCTITGSTVSITGAGSCTIIANQSGNATYNPAPNGSQSFTINPASSTTTVTCPTSATYTGSAITPCSVTVTGAGGLSLTPAPAYTNNVNAGTASASYTYAGDLNHAGSTGSKTFGITQASSTVTVTCPPSATYTGSAITPCSAQATGVGMSPVDVSASLTYSNNVNVGTATADASYAGDLNHAGNTGSKTFTIDPASSTTTVSCPASQTYSGSAITPCSVTVTGAGGLSLTPAPSYGNNVNAGTASASYTYAGDTNHAGSTGSKTFGITQASSTVTVTCPASVTYTGSAITPCTASYSGAGGLTGTLTPTYTNNVIVGTATADANYAGDANHAGSSGSDNFEIISLPTYSVSGYVSDNLGAALSGVFVQNNSNSDTTIASGYYSISGLVNGTYSFSYSKVGFNTGHLEVTVSGANIENANKTILDTTAPETIIDSSPPVSSGSSSASFTFHSTETGSTFQCQLDSGSFSACSSPETYSGLADGSHTFNVAATDAMGNADATPASFTWTIDTRAPSAITNLAAGSPTTNSITLTWTAPGDDGITGTASQYDIRYSTSTIDNTNWDSATQVTGEPSPKAFGQSETFIVSGLLPSQLYHFAIKTGDEVPNWSGLSNGAGATTTALPSVRYINGTVNSSSILHEALAGVTVTTGIQTITTGPDGKYSFEVVSGTYDLTFNKNDIRYYTGSLTGVSTVSGNANGDFELQLKPVGTISGTVTVV